MLMKKLCTALAVGSFALGATATVAAAGPPAGAGGAGKPAGIACQQAGISTLQSLGLLPAVAAGGIEVVGLGQVPFKDVLAFHRTNPALFQTGGVSVVVPGIGTVAATWCDPAT
jgi:hypothetical protein